MEEDGRSERRQRKESEMKSEFTIEYNSYVASEAD